MMDSIHCPLDPEADMLQIQPVQKKKIKMMSSARKSLALYTKRKELSLIVLNMFVYFPKHLLKFVHGIVATKICKIVDCMKIKFSKFFRS